MLTGLFSFTEVAISSITDKSTPQHFSRVFTVKMPSFTLLSFSPINGATNVGIESPIVLNFSQPVDFTSAKPILNPPIAGTWVKTGLDQLTFEPSAFGTYGATETVTVTANTKDLEGDSLENPQVITFSYQDGPVLRLEQLLAELNYLPLSFNPTGQNVTLSSLPYVQQGSFSWKYPQIQSYLQSYWNPQEYNLITKAAVMTFERANNMTVDGIAGPEVWSRLFYDYIANKTDPYPYYYVLVSTSLPEKLDVFVNGNLSYSTLVNTGIPQSPTELGTFPIYARFTSTTMSGRNPDGSYYHDTGVPWVSYFNGGDALHGFLRPGYGYPQSLGCVEMPYSNAYQVFNLTTYGTLVTVTSQPIP